MTMHQLIAWGIVLGVIALLPFMIVFARKSARGAAGGAVLALGVAFGNLFDPASKSASAEILKHRENDVEEDGAGDPPGRD